ncbi:hypothetical protein [Bremerella sp. P1]|nr:hypothetical protein [Bremerella sp. P1]WDI41516.1 hypothetical protein PSR63_23920 [Bremerella sp. P1]
MLVFEQDDQYDVLPFFWVPEEGAKRREKRDHAPYIPWIQQRYIEASPG